MIRYVPSRFVTQQICENVIRVEPGFLSLIPEQIKTQDLC